MSVILIERTAFQPGIPMNIGGPEMRFSGQGRSHSYEYRCSPLLSGIGQVATTTNNVTPRPTDVNTAVQKQEPIDLQEIDFDDTPVDPDVFTNEVDYTPEYDGVEVEHRFNYQYTNTMNPYPNSTFRYKFLNGTNILSLEREK